MTTRSLTCDGCGQFASPEHIARRLQRLEWTTRYRPIHIATLLMGAISPQRDPDFLYAGAFEDEAARLLEVAGIQPSGKTAEAVLAEFQRGGYFLTYMLECPLEAGTGGGARVIDVTELLAQRAGAVLARVRRSLKPKRTLLFGEELGPVVERFSSEELGCPVILDAGKPFAFEVAALADSASRWRRALATTGSAL